MSTPEEDFKEQGFHSKSEMRRLNIQRTVGTDGLKEVSEEAKGNGVQVSSRAPFNEIDKKIEEDFVKAVMDIQEIDLSDCDKEFTDLYWWDKKAFFKSAALPLHQEIEQLKDDREAAWDAIQELRDELDELTAPFTPSLSMDDLAEHNLEVREKLKLDAPTKARS